MGLKELARKDAEHTIEGAQAGNTVFSLSDDGGHSWEITGFVGDIGYSFDTDGNQIAGRTVFASFLADRVQIDGENIVPRRGWRLSYTDIAGEKHSLFVLFAEPDKSIGIIRVYLVADLSGAEENDD